VGDAVLRELAARLRAGVRPNDLIGRFGGEEFLIVLNGCDAARLPERAEKLCKAVSESCISIDSRDISFTVSIGAVAVDPLDAKTPSETVLNLADAALYQAKKEGRNRVVIAQRLVRGSIC
jgi:diguanylate cyclase (GGDEF)-like protein